MNLFETATRNKYRFQCAKGLLTTEDLWTLSLQSLDAIAQATNASLKATKEESFIKTRSNGSTELQNKLDILVHIISVKIEEQDKQKARIEKHAQIAQLKQIRADKAVAEMGAKSTDELDKMIAQLEAEMA